MPFTWPASNFGNWPNELYPNRVHLEVTRDANRPGKLAGRQPLTERRTETVTGIRQHTAEAHADRYQARVCRLMGWSGRAPAPPAIEAGKGRQRQGAHHVSATAQTAVAVIGIDIGKNSFHVVGLDSRGAIVLRQKWSRGQVEARLANMSPCLIGMEACVGAHHLSRKLKALGHDARLMPAKYVRPYSKGQKNDFRDAEAIAEAVQRPTMKFVATKTAEQLDLQALHRVRERLVSQRTGVVNQIRAFLLERGVAVRQGLRFLRAELPRLLATPPDVLSPRMVRVIEGLAEDWHRLDERIDHLSDEITALARQDAGCERLVSVPGIGPIISSAMVAAIGNGDAFSKGCDFAAWPGLVSKQISTGENRPNPTNTSLHLRAFNDWGLFCGTHQGRSRPDR